MTANKIKGKTKKPTVLSMFAGCGGIDLGFSQAGFEIVWANDIDSDACQTYNANIGKGKIAHRKGEEIVCGDIDNIPIPPIRDLDVLTAGFPCQPFSNAGQRRSVKDSRGTLYTYCFNFIDDLKPKFVLFENVRGFLSIKGHEKPICEEVMDELVNRKYSVSINLLNAAHYGVPQNRLRVFILGVRKDAGIRSVAFPKRVFGKDLTLKTVLDIPRNTPNQTDIVSLNPQALTIGAMVPERGSWKDIPYDKLPPRLQRIKDDIRRYRWPNFFRRFGRDEISGTVTAAFKPENAGVWHPKEDRVLTAREIARIQTFPDNFVFYAKSVKSIYAMIGNAVPPLLAKAFAESIKKAMSNKGSMSIVRDYFEIKRSGKPIRPGDVEMSYDPNRNTQSPRMLFNDRG